MSFVIGYLSFVPYAKRYPLYPLVHNIICYLSRERDRLSRAKLRRIYLFFLLIDLPVP